MDGVAGYSGWRWIFILEVRWRRQSAQVYEASPDVLNSHTGYHDRRRRSCCLLRPR